MEYIYTDQRGERHVIYADTYEQMRDIAVAIGRGKTKYYPPGEPMEYDYEYTTFRGALDPKVTAIEPSTQEANLRKHEEKKKEYELEQKVEKLQQKHDDKLLELRSARRTLVTYRKGMRAWIWGLIGSISTLLSGLTVGVGSDFFNVDLTGAASILIGTGVIATIATGTGLGLFYDTHRVGERTSKGRVLGLVDPEFSVELAEGEYTKALRDLTEVGGV